MSPKEQTRLQVLNSLMAEDMALDQAATLMGVSASRMLAAYREKGVAAVAHGHRGRRAPNATPETVSADVVHLAAPGTQVPTIPILASCSANARAST